MRKNIDLVASHGSWVMYIPGFVRGISGLYTKKNFQDEKKNT
jgi:hypothetical protein